VSPISGLAGARRGCLFTRKEDAISAVTALMTCQDHHGQHHFAVVNEGLAVWMSLAGFECLSKRFPLLMESRVRPPGPSGPAEA
jgi:hypothetical protein